MLIVGCAASPDKGKPEQYFSTQVSNDGRKLFSLSVTLPGKDRKYLRRLTSGRGPDVRESKEQMEKRNGQAAQQHRYVDLLERHLDVQGYCKLGYEITEQYRRGDFYMIQGQCNDKVSKK